MYFIIFGKCSKFDHFFKYLKNEIQKLYLKNELHIYNQCKKLDIL